MKIILVTKRDSWYNQQLIKEAANLKVEIEVVSWSNFSEINIKKLSNKDNVLIWRSSWLETRIEKHTLLSILKRKNVQIINRGIVEYPLVTHKLFQQKFVKEFIGKINSIKTYSFKKIDDVKKIIADGQIKFPFIKKPNLGSKGIGVELVRDNEDLKKISNKEIDKFIFQNYVKNDGDYRVLVLGGKPVGAIKRISSDGSFLNNISMGAKAVEIKSGDIRNELYEIATQVASIFNLNFCGVDIIFDQISKKYYFLEVNTAPEWEGFQSVTNINVAQKIIEYCKILEDRNNKSVYENVKKYYLSDLDSLADKKFHFCSRYYLWSGDKKAYEELINIDKFYVQKGDKDAFENRIKEVVRDKKIYQKKAYNGKIFRENSIKKYPMLGSYATVLFDNLMAENIHGKELRPIISQVIPDQNLIKLRNELWENKDDLLSLATFAVNYLYLVENYFKERKDMVVEPRGLWNIIKNIKINKGREHSLVTNDIYFITHCIIGESGFYKRKIKRKKAFYKKILRVAEELIELYYLDLSLDIKLEFLVCSRMLDYQSKIEERIMNEIEYSYSPIGNYLVDILGRNRKGRKDFLGSEHRNILYIMASSAFNPVNKKTII